jgi:hypothetical protein
MRISELIISILQQGPQSSCPPQPSSTVPQRLPQALLTQQVPGVFAVVEVHIWPAPVQPQSMVPPQPLSSFEPHLPG